MYGDYLEGIVDAWVLGAGLLLGLAGGVWEVGWVRAVLGLVCGVGSALVR